MKNLLLFFFHEIRLINVIILKMSHNQHYFNDISQSLEKLRQMIGCFERSLWLVSQVSCIASWEMCEIPN